MPDDPAAEPRETLYDRGNVYVTLAAAREYARAYQPVLGEETARRDLTELLLDATCTRPSEAGRPSQWRRRLKSRRVEVQAHVLEERDLCVVVHVQVRPYPSGAGVRPRPPG